MVHRGQDVGVDTHGHRNGGVTESLGHDLMARRGLDETGFPSGSLVMRDFITHHWITLDGDTESWSAC